MAKLKRVGDFTPATKKIIAERAGHRCAHCDAQTTGPHSDPKKVLSKGEAGHIRAASPGGPRYDPVMNDEERASSENGVWLCASCHALVDGDESVFEVDDLEKLRDEHWTRVRRDVECEPQGRSDGSQVKLAQVVAELDRIDEELERLVRWPTGGTLLGRHKPPLDIYDEYARCGHESNVVFDRNRRELERLLHDLVALLEAGDHSDTAVQQAIRPPTAAVVMQLLAPYLTRANRPLPGELFAILQRTYPKLARWDGKVAVPLD